MKCHIFEMCIYAVSFIEMFSIYEIERSMKCPNYEINCLMKCPILAELYFLWNFPTPFMPHKLIMDLLVIRGLPPVFIKVLVTLFKNRFLKEDWPVSPCFTVLSGFAKYLEQDRKVYFQRPIKGSKSTQAIIWVIEDG